MTNREAQLNSVSIGSGGDASATAEIDPEQMGDGASITGIANRASTSYDLDLEYLDANGNVVDTVSVASGVAAGTATTFDKALRATRVNVKISDAGSGSGDATLTAVIR